MKREGEKIREKWKSNKRIFDRQYKYILIFMIAKHIGTQLF